MQSPQPNSPDPQQTQRAYAAGQARRAALERTRTTSPTAQKSNFNKVRWGCIGFALLAVVVLNVGVTLALGMRTLGENPLAAMGVSTVIAPTDEADAEDAGPLTTAEGDIQTRPLPALPTGTLYLLLLGVDARPDQISQAVRTDTMMVARIDFDNGNVRLLSLPRDMWLAMPASVQDYGVDVGRINQGYYYGELYDLPGGGPQGAIDTVALNFGIPIEGYALVNFQSFVNVVDALGGIDIDVPKPIYDARYPTDNYGYIVLEIPAGPQHMDGITALRYARTRHQDNDFRRIERQQQVLIAIRDSALDVDVLARVPDLLAAIEGNFLTSMTPEQIIAYGLAGQAIPREKISTYQIEQTMMVPWVTPGGAHVWIPRREQIAPLIEEFMRPD